MIQVLILDRNYMNSQMLADSVAKNSRFRPVAVTSTAEALSAINTGQIHIGVISADLDCGQSLGAQFARTVHISYPQLGIVILLDHAERYSVIEAFRSGARGIFSRTESIGEFLCCVEQVSRGNIWAGKAESDFLLQALRSIPAPRIADRQLTKRELQVVQYAARGYTNKGIAEKLDLSEHTVKNYLFHSFEKLGVSSRVELLFFLTMEGKNSYDIDTLNEEASLDNCCRVAEQGFAAANLVLDIAAEKGWGTQKSQLDAYCWLRLAESYSEQVAARSHLLAEQLKNSLNADQIHDLDSKISEAARNFSSSAPKSARKLVEHAGDDWPSSKSA